MNRALIVLYLAASVSAVAGEEIPDFADAFLVNYCLDCHDADTEKGDLNLDFTEIDWTAPHSAITWAKVFDALEAREMPPEDKRQPSAADRQALVAWLEESLIRFDPPGGTVLRRLNRAEYENSVRQVLGIPFTTPAGFPADSEWHGFDNNGEGLVLSPPLLKQYFQLAGMAADLVIPPPKPPEKIEPVEISISPEGLGGSRRPGALVDGQKRYRLVDSAFAKGTVAFRPLVSWPKSAASTELRFRRRRSGRQPRGIPGAMGRSFCRSWPTNVRTITSENLEACRSSRNSRCCPAAIPGSRLPPKSS